MCPEDDAGYLQRLLRQVNPLPEPQNTAKINVFPARTLRAHFRTQNAKTGEKHPEIKHYSMYMCISIYTTTEPAKEIESEKA